MNIESKSNKYADTPLFFMRCCKKVLFQPKIIVLDDKVVLKFRCPYCNRVTILESQGGLKQALEECKERNENDSDGEKDA